MLLVYITYRLFYVSNFLFYQVWAITLCLSTVEYHNTGSLYGRTMPGIITKELCLAEIYSLRAKVFTRRIPDYPYYTMRFSYVALEIKTNAN